MSLPLGVTSTLRISAAAIAVVATSPSAGAPVEVQLATVTRLPDRSTTTRSYDCGPP